MQFVLRSPALDALASSMAALASSFAVLVAGEVGDSSTSDRIETKLDAIIVTQASHTAALKELMADNAQLVAALAKIDTATTTMGTNIGTLGGVTQTISDEIDTLEANLAAAGVSPALVAQASALGDRLQTVSDSLDAHGVALSAIASKGADTPVPVVPPVLPPPVADPTAATPPS